MTLNRTTVGMLAALSIIFLLTLLACIVVGVELLNNQPVNMLAVGYLGSVLGFAYNELGYHQGKEGANGASTIR